ncbi:MAG: DMT family transporter [Bacteroidetes bacterium]|nr:DMT family transporter [Bacteroidota bacterium]
MTQKTRAEIALLSMTMIWGGTFPIVKIGMEFISPILMVAIRFAIGAALLLLFARKRIFPLPEGSITKGSVLSLFLFLGFVAQNIGLTITTASKSAFITGLMVIFVPLLQFVIERRAPKLGNVVGVLVVVAGLWLLTSPEGAGLNAGDALTLVCAVLFAVYIVYLDVIAKEMSAVQLLFIQMAATTVFAVPVTALFETPYFVLNTHSVGALLYLTLLATLLTTYVQTRYQKDTTPTRAVVIFSVEPVIASFLSYLILGEILGPLGILGGALIISGVLLSELSDGIPLLNRSLGNTG